MLANDGDKSQASGIGFNDGWEQVIGSDNTYGGWMNLGSLWSTELDWVNYCYSTSSTHRAIPQPQNSMPAKAQVVTPSITGNVWSVTKI